MNRLDVKKIREELGLTQKELANVLESNIRTVQKWESGESKIRKSTAFMLHDLRSKGVNKMQNVKNELKKDRFEFDKIKDIGDFVAENFDSVRKASSYFDLVMREKKREDIKVHLEERGIKIQYIPKKE